MKLREPFGSGERIGLLTLPFLVVGVLLNLVLPLYSRWLAPSLSCGQFPSSFLSLGSLGGPGR